MTLEKQKTRAHAADAKVPTGSDGGAGSPNKFEDAEFKLQKEEDKVTRESGGTRAQGHKGRRGTRAQGHKGAGARWATDDTLQQDTRWREVGVP